jgi:hypothetical protein
MKRPSFQFYPADWRKDAELQSCSLLARGLWHEVLCIMHECEPYGELRVNGKPMTADQLGRLVGITTAECKRCIQELEAAGVPSRTEDGALFSRRMVHDEAIRNARSTAGAAGAEYGKKGAAHGSKGGRPRKSTGVTQQQFENGEDGKKPPLDVSREGVLETPLKPPPSSSSSSSTSVKKVSSEPAKPKTPLPPSAREAALLLCEELEIKLENDPERVNWPGKIQQWLDRGGVLGDLLKAGKRSRARGDPPGKLGLYLKMSEDEKASREAEEGAYGDVKSPTKDYWLTHAEIRKQRLEALRMYADDGRWVPNELPNGVWGDAFDTGAPPDDPRTKITEELLDAVPGARARRDKLLAGKGTT